MFHFFESVNNNKILRLNALILIRVLYDLITLHMKNMIHAQVLKQDMPLLYFQMA